MKTYLIIFYTNWVASDKTLDSYADDHGITTKEAVRLIEMGQKYQHQMQN